MEYPGPKQLRAMTESDLMDIVRTNSRVGYGLAQQALDELQFRFATKVQTSTTNLLESSNNLAQLIEHLTDATRGVHREVSALASSSGRLESSTVRLNTLTLVLIVLTALAAVIPLSVEVWKSSNERPLIVYPVPPPPSAPQRPIPPPR